MKLMPPGGLRYVYGGEEARSIYNRLDRDLGLATYFTTRLFATDGGHSFIVGRDREFLNRTFYLLLRRRPVIYHESWNIVEVYHRHKLLKELEGFGVKGYRITWNDREVCQYLGELVRKGTVPARDEPGVDSLFREWPAGTTEASGSAVTPKTSPQEISASSPKPKPGTGDPFAGLSVQITPFLRGVMKNQLFAGVRDCFRQAMDSYSARIFGKELAKLSAGEIAKFMTDVSEALSKKDLKAILGK